MNIKDIAKASGVSIATVSRVINNTAKVNDETRMRVEEAIKNANYRPNSLARELQQRKTNTIGVILSVAQLSDFAVSDALNAIADVLNSNGYNMMIVNSRFHPDEEIEFFHTFQEKRVDGILYFASTFTENHHRVLENYPIPIVIIGQEYTKLNIPCAVFDDYNAAKKATEYLISKGHSRIGYIGCPMYDYATGVERKRGFEVAMTTNGLTIDEKMQALGNFSLESGYKSMKMIHESNDELPTAVFAATDYMAMGAMHYLKENNIKVPEQVSVIGFDDVSVSEYYNPALTTIRTDKKAIGQIAAVNLLRLIKKEDLETSKTVVSFNLIERNSVINA